MQPSSLCTAPSAAAASSFTVNSCLSRCLACSILPIGSAQPMKGAGPPAARFARRGPARGVDPTEQHQDTGPPPTDQSCFAAFNRHEYLPLRHTRYSACLILIMASLLSGRVSSSGVLSRRCRAEPAATVHPCAASVTAVQASGQHARRAEMLHGSSAAAGGPIQRAGAAQRRKAGVVRFSTDSATAPSRCATVQRGYLNGCTPTWPAICILTCAF